MKKRSFLAAYVLTLAFLVGSFFLGKQVYDYSKEYKHSKNEYLATLNWKKRLSSKSEWANGLKVKKQDIKVLDNVIEWLNDFKKEGVDDMNWTERKKESEKIIAEADANYAEAVKYSWFLAGAMVLFLIAVPVIYTRSYSFYKSIAYALICVSFVAVIVGIFTPMMELEVYKENLTLPEEPISIAGLVEYQKTFEGKLYIQYVNKSILDVVGILFKGGNYAIGAAILMFSILVPIIKLALSMIVLLRKKKSPTMSSIINFIGKWSMADVFVVGVYLALLSIYSISPGVAFSYTLVGVYFFLAYCVLSITSSYFIKMARKELTKEKMELHE